MDIDIQLGNVTVAFIHKPGEADYSEATAYCQIYVSSSLLKMVKKSVHIYVRVIKVKLFLCTS